MSSFKKESKIKCDFRNDPVMLDNNDQVILEVKVCVKDQDKNVKLDWSVDEFLTATDQETGQDIDVNPNANVVYTLCNNDQQIGSTVTSGHSNRTVTSASDLITGNPVMFSPFESSFTQNNQPNFTFCDTPSLGMNCYQVKARKLDPADGATSTATVTDRTLNALFVDKLDKC
ncbi:hypothetical protein VQL36_01110 [Chengkuizengella sp. SCS-71B]|uniref:hypothetical protein n=1 Tax=Chengkuizengella sp. SCS-71B TaxID=3115290 RepID=UPI0032C2455B